MQIAENVLPVMINVETVRMIPNALAANQILFCKEPPAHQVV